MKQEIRTVIADDEPLARRMLRSLLQKDSQITVIAEARDGHEAEEVVRRLEPDLLMLDVQMPGGDGFRALRDLEKLPVLIFITAHPEHAMRAFDFEAVDYLLKPFDDERFERAVSRAKAAVRARALVNLVQAVAQDTAPSQRRPADRGGERVALNEGRRIVMMDVRDIDWVEAADYYAQVHARGAVHLIREPLLELERRLGPKRFVRIHRNAIVNMDRVQRLERLDDGELFAVLLDGTRLKVSRSRRQMVGSLLNAL
jgi:two-component system, LytTR family, response regulator